MPIQLVAHRGLWKQKDDGNSLDALTAALSHGFGVETDVRDQVQQLVIAHDVPAGPCLPLRRLFQRYIEIGSSAPLALNIKSDGLAPQIAECIEEFNIQNYFVFDMSVPDCLTYLIQGVPFYSRQSEYEQDVVLSDKCCGVWLDAFHDDWFDIDTIERHHKQGKTVCVVSPELHGRPPERVWQALYDTYSDSSVTVQLCTDYALSLQEDYCHATN